MNIIIVNDYAHVDGGASMVALSTAKSLGERGHQVLLFTAVSPIANELNSENINIVCLEQDDILNNPNRGAAIIQGLWNTIAQREMAKILVENQMDKRDTIVHVHTWTKALSSSPVKEAIKQGYKVVITVHDYFLACPNGGLYNYKSDRICQLKPLSISCLTTNCDVRNYFQKVWRYSRQLIQMKIGGMPHRINNFIVIGSLSRSIISPYLPPGSNVFELTNPTDIMRLPKVDVKENGDFVCIGTLAKHKGSHIFAEAASDLDLSAVFIGDGPFESVVKDLYPESKVTGWLPKPQVEGHLRGARALVFPSLWYEGQPLVVREALAMGVPVIVSNECAGRDMVIDGVTGYWFKSGDISDLKAKIKLLQDDKTAEVLGNNAYHSYWDNPQDLGTYTEQLETIYSKILYDSNNPYRDKERIP